MSGFKWLNWCGLGGAALCTALAMAPAQSAADDTRVMIQPAVVQTTTTQTTVPVQQVGWRRGYYGYGPGVGVYGPGVGVYVGPRFGPRFYGPRVYRPYYGYGYGYGYPAYGYGYMW